MYMGAKLISALWLGGTIFAASPAIALAQIDGPAPIRVESNLVVVPASVLDADRMRTVAVQRTSCERANTEAFRNLRPSEPYLPKDCTQTAIHGLTSANFHVFEDGIEQKIQSVNFEPFASIEARDNLGDHLEWSFEPRAKWSTTELSPILDAVGHGHFYAVAYAPAKFGDGGCHKIVVKVDRPHAAVFADNEYCYTSDLASDPLNGTKFGQQMERDLTSPKNGHIKLSLQASFFFTDANRSRVDVALEFPWDVLNREWRDGKFYATVGVLGVVDQKEGSVTMRFSDLACCSSGTTNFISSSDPAALNGAQPTFDPLILPTRYETQMDLTPGEYDLRIVLSDGSRFGRVEVPLVIDAYDGKQLVISSLVLSKRVRNASAAAQEAMAVNLAQKYVPLVSKGLEFTPTGNTVFKKTDSLFAYYEVSEPLLTTVPATTVETRVRIVNSGTGQLETDTDWRSVADWIQATSSVIHVSQEVNLKELAKGSYRIEVQATDSAGRSTVWRTANFAVQ